MSKHLFTTNVLQHAHDMRADDVCVKDGCGQRRDADVHAYNVPPFGTEVERRTNPGGGSGVARGVCVSAARRERRRSSWIRSSLARRGLTAYVSPAMSRGLSFAASATSSTRRRSQTVKGQTDEAI